MHSLIMCLFIKGVNNEQCAKCINYKCNASSFKYITLSDFKANIYQLYTNNHKAIDPTCTRCSHATPLKPL